MSPFFVLKQFFNTFQIRKEAFLKCSWNLKVLQKLTTVLKLHEEEIKSINHFVNEKGLISMCDVLFWWCAPLSQTYFHCTELGGTKVSPLLHSLLYSTTSLSSAPLLCSYPNKLASQVWGGRRRRVRRRVGGLGLVAEESAFSRWGAQCPEAALFRHTRRVWVSGCWERRRGESFS